MVHDRRPPRDSLLPLTTAARLVYARATGSHTSDIDKLNAVATLIAARTPLFSLNADETARPVPSDSIADGEFVEGGASVRFRDQSRAPINSLAIRWLDLGDVMEEVRRLHGQSSSLGPK